jgi:integrase/recombinase XerC/integrase/recombinase XerD
LVARADAVTVDVAVAAFLDTFSRPEQAGTRRTYAEILTFVQRDPFDRHDPIDAFDQPKVAEILRRRFAEKWAGAAGSTWNRNLAAIRSACAYWRSQHWITGDPLAGLERAKPPENRARVRSRTAIGQLLSRSDTALRERTLWALLYESAARAQEVLLLDVADLDRPNRRAIVRRKGGAVDEITWQTRTARLLGRHLAGRPGPRHRPGPAFLPAGRRAVQAGLWRVDTARPAAFRVDPFRRGRDAHPDADDQVRARQHPHPVPLRPALGGRPGPLAG